MIYNVPDQRLGKINKKKQTLIKNVRTNKQRLNKKNQHLWFKLTYCQICLQDVGMLLYPFISVALFQDLVRNLTLLDLMGVKADTKPLLNVRNLKKFTLYLYTYVTDYSIFIWKSTSKGEVLFPFVNYIFDHFDLCNFSR